MAGKVLCCAACGGSATPMKIGDEVEYTERVNGIDAENCIRGTITEIIEGQVLLDIDTGERRPAMRFVIRDRTGVHHITQAMSAGALPPVADKQEAGTVSRELPDSKSSVEEQN
jgi:hypothetical protein